MRARTLAIASAVTALVALQPGAAEAATGPKALQKLAAAQSQLLLSNLNAPLGEQVVSPSDCNDGQSAKGTKGTFLLPTFAGSPGKVTLTCHIKAHRVLVDLFGFVVTEDNRFEQGSFYELNGQKLPFTKGNLERICDDVVKQLSPAPASLDGQPLPGATAVSTAPFTSRVNRKSGQLYEDSVDLGHPGKIATTYCGHKATVHLKKGHHIIKVVLTGSVGETTVLTYDIYVEN